MKVETAVDVLTPSGFETAKQEWVLVGDPVVWRTRLKAREAFLTADLDELCDALELWLGA